MNFGEFLSKHFVLLLFIFLLILLFLILLAVSRNRLSVSRYEVSAEKLPPDFNDLKIVQVSDLHGMQFGKDNERLLGLIQKEEPDLIVITGDLVTKGRKEFPAAENLVRELARRFPTYFAPGNHEEKLPEADLAELLDSFRRSGAHVLMNESVLLISSPLGNLRLTGLRLPLTSYHRLSRSFVSPEPDDFSSLCSAGSHEFSILLAHNPNFFPQYQAAGFDLIFSGHVHGGMVRLPPSRAVFQPMTSWTSNVR